MRKWPSPLVRSGLLCLCNPRSTHLVEASGESSVQHACYGDEVGLIEPKGAQRLTRSGQWGLVEEGAHERCATHTTMTLKARGLARLSRARSMVMQIGSLGRLCISDRGMEMSQSSCPMRFPCTHQEARIGTRCFGST